MVRSQNVSLASYGVSCGADLDTTSPGVVYTELCVCFLLIDL